MQFLLSFKAAVRKKAIHTINRKSLINTNSQITLASQENTIIQYAVDGNWSEIVPLLPLKKNYKSFDQKTIVHFAAQTAGSSILQMIINSGMPLNCKDLMMQTPLHKAVLRGDIDILLILLKAGCNPNLQDIQGNTPCHLASALGNIQITQKLLSVAQPFIRNISNLLPSQVSYKNIVIKNLLSQAQSKFSQRILYHLNIYKQIGRGSFGHVYYCQLDGKQLALKQIKKPVGSSLVKYLLSQKEIMQNVSHPSLLGMKACFQTKSAFYIVSQFCSKANLASALRNKNILSQKKVRNIVRQVLSGLKQLHKRGWIYRDLKPSNILFDSKGVLKLADFGLCKLLKSSQIKTFSLCGCMSYIAPQVFSMKGYNQSADYFMLGMLIFQCIIGRPANQEQNLNNALRYQSRQLRDLIIRLIQKNPQKRIGYKGGISQIENHSWFRGQQEKFTTQNVGVKKNTCLTVQQMQCELQQSNQWVDGWQWVGPSLFQ